MQQVSTEQELPKTKPATPPAAPAAVAPAAPEFSVLVIKDVAVLREQLTAWESLVSSAIEANIFYEPWMFLAALEVFGKGLDLRFVFVTRTKNTTPPSAPELCGFFPLEYRRGYKGLPITAARLWQHRHCFLCLPLLRSGCAPQALAAFMDWFSKDGAASLLELEDAPGDGVTAQLFADLITDREYLSYTDTLCSRPMLCPRASADEYLKAAFSSKTLSSLRAKRRKLVALDMTIEQLDKEEALGQWIQEFIDLETSGWKGRNGSALGSNPENVTYFNAIIRESFRRGSLQFRALRLKGEAVAMACIFRTGDAGFYFKKTFAEKFNHLSPGYILEIERIQVLHDKPDTKWMDSCTATDTSDLVFSRWLDHRMIQTFVIAADREPARLIVSLLPLARWMRRALGRLKGGKGSADKNKNGDE